MATELYTRVIEFNHDDPEMNELAHQVWDGTPWMIDVFVGRWDEGRSRDILHWCYVNLGPCSSPFGSAPKPGRWRQGNATIHGWTWFGFAEEKDMKAFQERWPSPAHGVSEELDAQDH